MSTDEERKILDDIKKSGYPLEIDVTHWLIENGWSVFPQYTYLDAETKKIRTIDALVIYLPGGSYFESFPRLIVECKTSNKPWVFYTRPSLALDVAQFGKKGFDFLTWTTIPLTMISLFQQYVDWKPPKIPHVANWPKAIKELMGHLHFFQDLPRAHSCYVAFQSKEDDAPSSFQRAVYQIRGATHYLSEESPKWPLLATIVLRGKLFEYCRDGSNLRIKPVDHILYSTYELIEEREFYQYPAPTIIDVVKDDYFTNYLAVLKKDYEALGRAYEALKGGEKAK